MRYHKVYIDAIGYELGPVVVSSDELEERLAPLYEKLHIPRGQLELMTGVAERRWWESGARLSDGAITAARKALALSGVEAADLGAVLYTAVCREGFEPATACRVAAEIGARGDTEVYDLSNACLGVLNGMLVVADAIELGRIRAGLVVSCESARAIVEESINDMLESKNLGEFSTSLATLTGGSGAVAVLLTDGSFETQWGRRRLLGGVAKAAPEHHDLCRWGMTEVRPALHKQYMVTDAVSVLKHGVELGRRTWDAFLEEMDWSRDDVDRIVCHQVGQSNRNAILAAINVSAQKDYVSYPFLGNVGTVSLPLTAALAQERGVLRTGDKVGFLGIGSGLNCLMLGVDW